MGAAFSTCSSESELLDDFFDDFLEELELELLDCLRLGMEF